MESRNRKGGEEQNSKGKSGNTNDATAQPKDLSVSEYEQMAEEVNEARTKKPGSQSNNSDQHNNGRGGGK